MTAPNMETITESLERSLQNCSLNHERRSSGGGGGAVEGILGRSSTSDVNNLPNTVSDTSLELNSHLSLPYHWEQCLDLKVRSFLVFVFLVYFFFLSSVYLLKWLLQFLVLFVFKTQLMRNPWHYSRSCSFICCVYFVFVVYIWFFFSLFLYLLLPWWSPFLPTHAKRRVSDHNPNKRITFLCFFYFPISFTSFGSRLLLSCGD